MTVVLLHYTYIKCTAIFLYTQFCWWWIFFFVKSIFLKNNKFQDFSFFKARLLYILITAWCSTTWWVRRMKWLISMNSWRMKPMIHFQNINCLGNQNSKSDSSKNFHGAQATTLFLPVNVRIHFIFGIYARLKNNCWSNACAWGHWNWTPDIFSVEIVWNCWSVFPGWIEFVNDLAFV